MKHGGVIHACSGCCYFGFEGTQEEFVDSLSGRTDMDYEDNFHVEHCMNWNYVDRCKCCSNAAWAGRFGDNRHAHSTGHGIRAHGCGECQKFFCQKDPRFPETDCFYKEVSQQLGDLACPHENKRSDLCGGCMVDYRRVEFWHCVDCLSDACKRFQNETIRMREEMNHMREEMEHLRNENKELRQRTNSS